MRRTRLTLRPGSKGTQGMLDKYGARLVAVRYHYDPVRKLRTKTVELVEEVVPWRKRITARQIVPVRIGYLEHELRRKVKAKGATWDRARDAWVLPYGLAVKLGLKPRIVWANLLA